MVRFSGRPVAVAYVDLIVNVLISNLWAVKDLLTVLVSLFVVPRKDLADIGGGVRGGGAVEAEMKCRRRHDTVFANAHFALHGVLRRIPGAKHHLIPILEKLVKDTFQTSFVYISRSIFPFLVSTSY